MQGCHIILYVEHCVWLRYLFLGNLINFQFKSWTPIVPIVNPHTDSFVGAIDFNVPSWQSHPNSTALFYKGYKMPSYNSTLPSRY